MITVTHPAQIIPSVPYFALLTERWSLTGLTELLVIETAQDYLNRFGNEIPFDGFIQDYLHQVFIGIAVLNNSEVREVFIPASLLAGELSFLQEAL